MSSVNSISIAIATYNGADFINEQIKSILNQTKAPLEIIISDDASTDNTLEIIESIAKTSKIPIQVFKNNQTLGVSKNFFNAIQSCNGNFIALCDQDDVWSPDKLEKTYELLEKNPSKKMVISNANIYDQQLTQKLGTLWESLEFNRSLQHRFQTGDQISQLLKKNLAWGLTVMFRKELMNDENTFNGIWKSWCFDGWLGIKAALFSEIILCDESLLSYRQHRDNDVGSPKRKNIFRVLKKKEELKQPYINHLNRCKELQEYIEKKCLDNPKFDNNNYIYVKQFISALERRMNLPKSKGQKLFTIIKNYIKGDYDKISYQSPFLSAAKDIFITYT